ncbi:MAG: dTDP-4-dehydrorhamnose reductase [Bacteroidota bacterium]
MTYRRVLITGANGLLGQQLVERFSRLPRYDVLATGRDEAPKFAAASCGYANLDITSPEQVRQVFTDFAPSVVVNAAAMTNVDRCETDRDACWEVNVHGVEHLARMCKTTGARLVQVSTDFVFDGEAGPYTETDRPNPINHYGRSKLAAENAVRQLGLSSWTLVRAIIVYGTGRSLNQSNLALWILRRLRNGQTVPAFADQWRTFCYAPDLADGIERLVRFDKGGVYHLSGREFVTIVEFAQTLARVFGYDESLIVPSSMADVPLAAPRPPRTGLIVLKAETEIGFKPRSLEDACRHLARSLDGELVDG